MSERLIPKARLDDDTLGAQPSLESNENKEKIKYIQPKAQDAIEVERLGLMKVPKRFSYHEAQKALVSGMDIIARSEHPDEAEGLSGVNPSFFYRKGDVLEGRSPEQFREEMLKKGYYDGTVHKFCEINGIDKTVYDSKISWSFWERIPGINISVIEDNAVPGRHYILSTWPHKVSDERKRRIGIETIDISRILIVEGDSVQKTTENEHAIPLPTALMSSVQEVVDSYAKIKEHFGSHVAWVVEMQVSDKGDLYFLQRHPTRPVEKTVWKFEDQPEADEIVVHSSPDAIVRGATGKDGVELDLIINGRGNAAELPQQEVYSRGTAQNPVWFQKWIAQAQLYIESTGTSGGEANNPHSSVIPLTAPKVYVCAPMFRKVLREQWAEKIKDVRGKKDAAIQQKINDLRVALTEGKITAEEEEKQFQTYANDPEDEVRAKIRVRSDGTEARIKILSIH